MRYQSFQRPNSMGRQRTQRSPPLRSDSPRDSPDRKLRGTRTKNELQHHNMESGNLRAKMNSRGGGHFRDHSSSHRHVQYDEEIAQGKPSTLQDPSKKRPDSLMRRQHHVGGQTSRNGKMPSSREVGMKGERIVPFKPAEDKQPAIPSDVLPRSFKRDGGKKSFFKRDRTPKNSKAIEPKPSEEATNKPLPEVIPACVDDAEEEDDCQEETWGAAKPERKSLECCNQSAEVLVAE